MCSQLRDDDHVYSGHRAHGHAIAKGASLERVMAELMGRDTGLCRGSAARCTSSTSSTASWARPASSGGTVPIALGSALAARLRGTDAVAVVFFGDGAVQAGHFNETVNLATLWRLPLVLVCENNGFAEFTPRSAHTVVERVSDVVAPYGLERSTVDGNDVPAVWDAFGGYLASARAGGGPVPPRVPDAPGARATTRATPAAIARRSRRRSGRRRTRSCGSSGTGWRRAGTARTSSAAIAAAAAAAVEDAVRFGRESPFPPSALLEAAVYADG